MEPIRVLIFDDIQTSAFELQFALEQEWEKILQKNGGHLPLLKMTTIFERSRLHEAIREKELNRKYDFFLCDIFVGAVPSGAAQSHGEPIPEAEGFRFMKMAKDHGMPVCVGITRGDYGSFENTQRRYKEFERFIDGLYFKSQLYGFDDAEEPGKLVGEIVEMLRSKGIIRAVGADVKFDGAKQEARTFGILEEVGEQTIGSFADRFALPGATSFELSSIAPGLSGAKILKLTYRGSAEDYSTRPLLVKVSRDRRALIREIDAYRTNVQQPLRSLLQRLLAHPHGTGTEPLEANGWYGIAFEFAEPSESILSWLAADPTRERHQIEGVLRELFFSGGLADLYQTTSQRANYVKTLVDEGLLSHYRRMAILEAIEIFQPLLDKYVAGKEADLSYARLFIEHGRLKDVEIRELQRRMTPTCIVHGDFHGRNVLVVGMADRSVPRVIDLASMGRAIWPTDLVRLFCDVFVSGWDSGTKSYEWSELGNWARLMDKLKVEGGAFGDEETSDTPNRPVAFALDWLKQQKLAIAHLPEESYHQAEFALCLAVEFLRASYRDRDMPAPKRALGLIAGNALLQEANELFKR